MKYFNSKNKFENFLFKNFIETKFKMQNSPSEHSMITRSKGKLLELEGINPFEEDDMDEKGNLKGLIDYECNEDFDNEMFQKELRRLRGGRKNTQYNSPTKRKKKDSENKLSDVFLSYMLILDPMLFFHIYP